MISPKHVGSKHHVDIARPSSSFFQPTLSTNVIEAETRWALFVAKQIILHFSTVIMQLTKIFILP